MSVRNVSHVAIGVRDIERALPFWTDVVGLHIDLDTHGERIEGRAPRRAIYLRKKGGKDQPYVVLDQQFSEPPHGEAKALFEVGVHHFGFWVDDVDAIAQRARRAGVTILYEPHDNDTSGYGEPPGREV